MERAVRRGVIALLCCLAGCAAAPPPFASLPPDDPPPPAVLTAPPPDPRIAFEQRWSAQADVAEQQGRLADALWAREALVLALPGDRQQAAHLSRLRGLVALRSQEALARGRDAQKRGDLERAQRAFLQVLALEPEHAGAAEALRGTERERNERQWLGRFSRNLIQRSTSVGERPGERIASEHAAMLVAQGEIDGAIQLLSRAAEVPRADASLRRQLADLHVKRAQALPAERRAEALAALREALRLNPQHAGARQILSEMTPAPSPPAPKASPPRPAS